MKVTLHSTGDASRLAALLLGHKYPICSLVAPGQPGAAPGPHHASHAVRTLVKPTGFTSRDTELGATTVYRFSGGFQHDYSGKYGEYARYEYSGP